MSLSNEKAVAEKLLQAGAIKLQPQQPFTWASGWQSPIYCDNRRLLGFPYIRDFVKSEMCSLIFNRFADADLLAGVATAGIAWGAMAADQLKLPFVYVRPKPKTHGMGNQIEGYFEAGQPVLVIEDLISTGKSSLEVVEVLRQSGLNVVGMISIFTYGFPEAEAAIAAANLPYASLTNYSALVQLAAENGVVAADEIELLNRWRLDPAGWGR
jgi:orotate phosphoribosyltransferase